LTQPCQRGGSCISKGSNYQCKCINSVYGSNCEYYRDKTTNSTILSVNGMKKLKTLINLPQNQTLKMIDQESKDGFSSNKFHAKCNGVLGTLTVIKSNSSEKIFGGYTQDDWSGNVVYDYDSNAFLFSLINAYNKPVKMLVTDPQYPISGCYYGPTFGSRYANSGFDLYVSSDGSYGYSNLGNTYQLPSFLNNFSAQSFLAGSNIFKPIEIEVYSIFIDRKLKFFHFNFRKYYLI